MASMKHHSRRFISSSVTAVTSYTRAVCGRENIYETQKKNFTNTVQTLGH